MLFRVGRLRFPPPASKKGGFCMFNVFSVSAASATRWAMGEIPDMGLERGPLEVV